MSFYNELNNKNNFVVSYNPNPRSDFGVFAKGYARAATILSERLISSRHFSDYEAYPVVFLYRHSLELYLKNIIYKCTLILAFEGMHDIDKKLHNNHDLIQLSDIVSQILRKVFPDDPDIENLRKVLVRISNEFSKLDKNSFSYRYPIDKKGNYSTKHHQVANLQSIYENLSPIFDQLDVLDFGINIESENAQELYEFLENYKN